MTMLRVATVTVPWLDVTFAAGVGAAWHIEAIKRNADARDRWDDNSGQAAWNRHIEGALAEAAFCTYLDIDPRQHMAVNVYQSQADIAGCNVRLSANQTILCPKCKAAADKYHRPRSLMWRECEAPDTPLVAIAKSGPMAAGMQFNVLGWAFGNDIKKHPDAYFDAGGRGKAAAWFLSVGQLRPIETLHMHIKLGVSPCGT